MANDNLKPDGVADKVAPAGKVTEAVVTFRGWLSAKANGDPLTGGFYRVFRSPWLDEWFDIGKDDLLFRQQYIDGSSIFWVKREAKIVRCHEAKACHFADEETELGADPTVGDPIGAKYPRYGGGRP